MNQNKINILFINGNLKVGGVEMALSNLLNCLDFDKYNADLLLLQNGYDYEPSLPSEVNLIKTDLDQAQGAFISSLISNISKRNWVCVRYRVLNLFSRILSKRIFRFLHIGNDLNTKYDVVISFRPGICADLALYSFNSALKVCWWHHGNTDIGIPLPLLTDQLKRFNKIITVSDGAKQMLTEAMGHSKPLIAVVPNIIDIDCISNKANEYNPYQNTLTNKNTYRIVTVSRLSKEKNVIGLIETANILKSKNVKFSWHIIGDGDCMKSIRDKIDEYNLDSDVIIEGSQTNPYPWIKGADVMVHPSPVESFGIVILEAMSLGVPCIAVESIGARQLINGNNGVLVTNVSAIDTAFLSLVNDVVRKEEIVKNGLITAEGYSPQNVYKKFKSILNL